MPRPTPTPPPPPMSEEDILEQGGSMRDLRDRVNNQEPLVDRLWNLITKVLDSPNWRRYQQK